ncbi:uncharacterized protein, partial [Emydura macquarii macquarii]|uniref:uncharacterized protein n=1 Tax=Emydura macquarii macquarii TaxID=1129001 RepID=UPI00352B5F55
MRPVIAVIQDVAYKIFLTHALCVVESGRLVVMAFDCYVPICALLRYTSMLTGSVITKLVRWLLFCHSRIMYNPYCKHMAMTPRLFFLSHHFGHRVSPHVHIFLSNLDLLVPAMLNPLVYGARPCRSDRMLRTFRPGEDAPGNENWRSVTQPERVRRGHEELNTIYTGVGDPGWMVDKPRAGLLHLAAGTPGRLTYEHKAFALRPLRSSEHKGDQGNLRYIEETLFCLRVIHLLPYAMSDSNTTIFTNPSSFILLGIPGLEAAHVWISIPFCAMYAIAVLGNFTILLIVRMEQSLHAPMYYFLCMLAVIDLVLSTTILPKMLSIFWFNSREIKFSACFTQLYFIDWFAVMESGILVALGFDRYVAICDPLRHSTILTNAVVAKIGVALLLRGFLLMLPRTFVEPRWPYCRTVIAHTYCDQIAVVKLACADISFSSYYGLLVIFLVTGPDVSLITFSYIQILRAIFSLPTKDARLKTFGTCGSHLCVILAFYIPSLFSNFTQEFGHNVPLHFHVIAANMFLLLPPMLNPIIYGVRTKQIRDRLLHLLTQKGGTHKGPKVFSCCPGSQTEHHGEQASDLRAPGNVARLFLIKAEPGLREPTSLFLSMLTLTDITLSSSALPRTLGSFWLFNSRIICHPYCKHMAMRLPSSMFLSNLDLLVPAMLNLLVYGAKTQQIRQADEDAPPGAESP